MSSVASPRPPGHPPVRSGRVGVLLINLGTPSGTDTRSIRTYLAEFLTDRRVIEWPRAIWYPILFGIVLNRRPKRVGALYRTIWNTEADESFLRTYTRNQASELHKRLADLGPDVVIDWAMRYGVPTIAERIDALRAEGCDRILAFPLYPQYSATTTATVNDKVFEAIARLRWQPALRIVPPYPDEPAYIAALASSIRTATAKANLEPELILASFHGIPKSYFDRGDPYYCHAMKTTRLLREALKLPQDRLIATFQSRFGPETWLEPYTDKTIEALAKRGVKRIAVINPGFVSDCLETLEEIAVQARETFEHNGGETLLHVPCLNDTPEGISVLETLVRRNLAGWAPAAPNA